MNCLLADIGGTNSRFALCESGSYDIHEQRKYPNREFSGLEDVLAHYLHEVNAKPAHACIAVACPVLGDEVGLTNIHWSFSISSMARQFGLNLHVTNDFTALAMAIPQMQGTDVIKQIGGGSPVEQKPIGVLGPGTGLGVSGLLWSKHGWVPIQGEGGQVGLKAGNDLEIAILHYAQKVFGFVCAERIISGIGLSFLHKALLEINGRPTEELKAEEITRAALADKHSDARHAVEIFCGMLGAFAGDHALTLGAFGGIYIGGGVTPQLEHLFTDGPFRQRFEDKGRFTDYVKNIPTYMLRSHSSPALLGAAVILNQELGTL